jgi:HSP20 family protein
MFVVPYALHRARPAWGRVFDDATLRQFVRQDALARDPSPSRSTPWDVAESEAAYTVTMDLPGFDKTDVKVSIDAKRVVVEAKTPTPPAQGEGASAPNQRARSFTQAFTLPVVIDAAASSATLERGVLSLTLTKKHPPEAAVLTIN